MKLTPDQWDRVVGCAAVIGAVVVLLLMLNDNIS